MSIHQLTLNRITIVEEAIELLRAYEPSLGYHLCFSGGKDSVVIYDLAVKAGVKYDAHYNVSPVDPPEIYAFIKAEYPNVLWDFNVRGFWRTFMANGLPTRLQRWCCRLIKESGGRGRTKVLGMRSGESNKRSKYQCFQVSAKDPETAWVLPIVRWSEEEVWEYIRENKLPYCHLYDEGFKRLGCVLCPFKGVELTRQDMVRFPKITENWHRAALRYYDKMVAKHGHYKSFNNGEEYWLWWLTRK